MLGSMDNLNGRYGTGQSETYNVKGAYLIFSEEHIIKMVYCVKIEG